MIKHKRYYQFSSDLETAKMFYQEEMKKNSNNTFIRDDCIYRLSLIASMICREEDYCDYCCYSKLSSIIPSSSIDLSRIQKSNQSCKIYKNNFLFSNLNVDVDEFYLGDLNNVFIWPIQRSLFHNTKTAMIPSLASFHHHIRNLRSSCCFSNNSMENPILRYYIQYNYHDIPFFKESSIISNYIQNVDLIRKSISLHQDLLTAIGSLYLSPVYLDKAYSPSGPLCFSQLKANSWLSQDHYQSFLRNYQHISSQHWSIHSLIQEQLESDVKYSCIQDCCKYEVHL